MSERNVTVYLHDLDIPTRTRHGLMYAKIETLNELENKKPEDFSDIHGMGEDSLRDIENLLNNADEIFGRYERRKQRIDEICKEVSDIPIEDVNLGNRAYSALKNMGINTVEEMLNTPKKDIDNMRKVGALTKEEILTAIENIILDGKGYFDNFAETAKQEEADDKTEDIPLTGKGFDFELIELLTEQYNFKRGCMEEWYGYSRQYIYHVLNNDRRKQKYRGIWTGKELSDTEKDILKQLVKDRMFDYRDDAVICCCLNNKKDDFVCIFVYEDDIKCFFLKDLPEDIQGMITDSDMHKLTEREFSEDVDGDIISVLKKKYFAPKDQNLFRSLAVSRGLDIDEYSRFITGYPYRTSGGVTDDKIIEFFEANLVDGKVYISSDPKNQWIRAFASHNKYGIKELIEFYGYEYCTNGAELMGNKFKERHKEDDERYIVYDSYMRVRPYKKDDPFETKVFAAYPLIGSMIIKPETMKKLNEHSRKCIDKVLKDPTNKLTLSAKMKITLAIINNAKNWKSEDESDFWKYISLQFGFRDTTAVLNLLKNSVEDAMKENQRLFIEYSNGRGFKSTVVAHAMTPKKSWMALFDFLFDFYKNNLNWNIVPGDPLVGIMVDSLRQKLGGNNDEDVQLTISSQIYSFQEGIRKLVMHCPDFSRKLFERLIRKIDAMVNSSYEDPRTYEEQLCEEWFKEKLTAIVNTKRADRQYKAHDVAVDYSRIRARLVLKNENDVQIVIPDIRLTNEDFDSAVLDIYYNDSVVFHRNMTWYGNELGKTLNGDSISLPAFPENSGDMNIRVQITCGNEMIYDSEDSLYNRILAFSSENTVDIKQIKRGNYTFVVPKSADLDIKNAVVTEIDPFRNIGLKAYFTELQDGYIIRWSEGELLSFDSANGTDIRVFPPKESETLPYVTIEGNEYCFAYHGSVCNIIFDNADFSNRFVIQKNGEITELAASGDNDCARICPIDGEDDMCCIHIIDLENERCVFEKRFILIDAAECHFNRDFYFSQNDYTDAEYYINIDDFSETMSFTKEDEEIKIPFRNGEIRAAIAKIRIRETTGEWMNGSAPAWYIGNIPQDSRFIVSAPDKTEIRFFVGGSDIMYDGNGIVTIGNVLHSVSSGSSDAKVEMEIKGQRYSLAHVYFEERFLKTPAFRYENNKLFWDQGGAFIGKPNRKFTLTLFDESEVQTEFSIDELTESLDIPESMCIGSYRFEISIISRNLFKMTKEVIAEGDCIIGDENLLRFRNRRIIIDSVTDVDNEEAGHIPISVCYIDSVEFKGIEETSEGYCPVYSGVMYTKGNHGERYEFSFEKYTNKRGINKNAVNPVKIIYLNNNFLLITDPDGDGLYYYHKYDKYNEMTVYAITDWQYTNANKHKYSNADLYSYRTERIKNV